tara:strand:- start:114059 stop:114505 length:447 start_codon:yes stop_codon:yes gene_type:complete
MKVYHDTITLERDFDASAAEVFAAYADVKKREKWTTPEEGAEVQITACDFQTGGSETARCGTKGAMQYDLSLTYHMVEQEKLIVFSEELREGDNVLTVALITFEISEGENGKAHLNLTDQVTSFVGKDGAEGHRHGYSLALANLAAVA